MEEALRSSPAPLMITTLPQRLKRKRNLPRLATAAQAGRAAGAGAGAGADAARLSSPEHCPPSCGACMCEAAGWHGQREPGACACKAGRASQRQTKTEQAGRQAGRKAGRQAGRQAGRRAGRQAGGQAGRSQRAGGSSVPCSWHPARLTGVLVADDCEAVGHEALKLLLEGGVAGARAAHGVAGEPWAGPAGERGPRGPAAAEAAAALRRPGWRGWCGRSGADREPVL